MNSCQVAITSNRERISHLAPAHKTQVKVLQNRGRGGLVNVFLSPSYTFLDPLSKTLADTSIEMGSHPAMIGQKLMRNLGVYLSKKPPYPEMMSTDEYYA